MAESAIPPISPSRTRDPLVPLFKEPRSGDGTRTMSESPQGYRVYKRRWFGLTQLVLLNIVVSWDWLTFSPVSGTAAEFFHVSETAINWLSTGFLFSLCAISPVVLWTLNKGGPKPAIVTASVLVLLGNWIRYAGARADDGYFGVVMFGQIVSGLAQPFVLAAPTRYSDLWFTSRGRISATAVATLANPLGGALAQLINPSWVEKPADVPNMILYISIIATVASIPSFFLPAKPPTPPCPSAAEEKLALRQTAKVVVKTIDFWLLFVPFSVYVGFFNAFSSLINQILEPYGFSEVEAGICGALLLFVGLITAAVVSPFLDRHPRLPILALKMQVPIVALCYLAFIWVPEARNAAAPYVLACFLGGASFSILPIALEMLVEVTHPVSPEITSVASWFGGSLLGGVFILIMDTLKDGPNADPPFRLKRALVFEAVVALAVMPLPLCLGLFGSPAQKKRLEADQRAPTQRRLTVSSNDDATQVS